MGNTLKIELEGKVVIFKQAALTVPANAHPFLVTGGFGASSFTRGSALLGVFLSDGERTRMDGYDVERLATDDEIAAAKAIARVNTDPASPFQGMIEQANKQFLGLGKTEEE